MPEPPLERRPPLSDAPSAVRLSLEGGPDDIHENTTGAAPSFRPPLPIRS